MALMEYQKAYEVQLKLDFMPRLLLSTSAMVIRDMAVTVVSSWLKHHSDMI